MRFGRKILFACLTVLLGLLLLEGAARIIESRHASREGEESDRLAADSVLPFQQVKGRFLVESVLDGCPGFTFRDIDQPSQWIAATKPEGQLRVVLFGGSQAGGMGLAAEASFARLLQKWLRARHPERDIQVINLAATGYASPQHAYLARHVLPSLEPDLVLTVFGHNERLDVKAMIAEGLAPPRLLETTNAMQRHSALVRLLSPNRRASAGSGEAPGRPLPATHLDPQWQAFWRNRLTRSLHVIAQAVRELNAGLIICRPPSNPTFVELRDWWWVSPREMDPRLVQARHWLLYDRPEKAVALLRDVYRVRRDPALELLLGRTLAAAGQTAEAREHLQAAIRLLEQDRQISRDQARWMTVQALTTLGEHDRAATMVHDWLLDRGEAVGRQGVLGLALREIGEGNRAAEVLFAARDRDDLALRADGEVRETLQRAAEHEGLPFIDLDRDFSALCSDGICGFDMFFDYCHLTPAGNLRMAGLLLPIVEEALHLSSAEPNPAPAAERELRAALRDRERDFPELERWLGVCEEIWQLSDEKLDDQRCRLPESSSDPVTLVYRGNLELQNGVTPENLEKAAAYYRQALSLDPTFAAARANLAWINK